MPWSGLIC